MANDKTKLQEKADALRRDLSELDAQISKMKTEPESVKPRIDGVYGRYSGGFYVKDDKHYVRLAFDTLEQAEKARALLEKMEFGDPPFSRYEEYESLEANGKWEEDTWDGVRAELCVWHMGYMRKL